MKWIIKFSNFKAITSPTRCEKVWSASTCTAIIRSNCLLDKLQYWAVIICLLQSYNFGWTYNKNHINFANFRRRSLADNGNNSTATSLHHTFDCGRHTGLHIAPSWNRWNQMGENNWDRYLVDSFTPPLGHCFGLLVHDCWLCCAPKGKLTFTVTDTH